MLILAALSAGKILSAIYVALGLGLVIFFHELGHFAVAKWCNVNVERFSIGFGPIIWSTKRGETEYAISLIPFGGYVKMLGQDDMDPSQLTSEEIAQDPRSYSAKNVPQRMAIISAGVIMNILTAVIFFGIAYSVGVDVLPSSIGHVKVGMPAWEAGLESGDQITKINGKKSNSFLDIVQGVVVSTGDIEIEGIHADGTTFEKTIEPEMVETRRGIGAENPTTSLNVVQYEDKEYPPTLPGSPASEADPPFEQGDLIKKIDDVSLENFTQLSNYLAENRSKKVTFHVQRLDAPEGDLISIPVDPYPFYTLGIWMDIGTITGIQEDSPAAEAGFQVQDKITKINNKAVGTEINPLHLPYIFADLHGQEVTVSVSRPAEVGEAKEVDLKVVPRNKNGWITAPTSEGEPLSVPALGIAYHLVPSILKVEPDSPAAKAEIMVRDRVRKMVIIPPESEKPTVPNNEIVIKFGEEDSQGRVINNWAYAFWMMQRVADSKIQLSVSREGKIKEFEMTPEPSKAEQFYLPMRGITMMPLRHKMVAGSLGEAISMGLSDTKNNVYQIYFTLRSLFGGELSVKELRGPIGIAGIGYQIAKNGLADLMQFLGMLSVNLAVLNFLPIPVLDGGHMVFLAWEGITRKPPSEKVVAAGTYIGMAFVLSLMLLVLYLDIFVHWLKIG